MNYILFDDQSWLNLLPLTFTRPVSEIRIGILTIREKWQHYLEEETSWLTQDYLSEKFPCRKSSINLLVNGAVLPELSLIEEIKKLTPGQALTKNSRLLAACISGQMPASPAQLAETSFQHIESTSNPLIIDYPWHIFTNNGDALCSDYTLLTNKRTSATISKTNQVLCPENIFIEEGAVVEFAMLNAQTGPIYIGKDAEILEGSLVRGPFCLGEHSTLKMGAKIYGPTTIGPHCKVGGEVNNSVFFSYSNKAHDGFLGNSVLGEWCNLGADTNNSNLKNNYAQVRLWNYAQEKFINTGLQFCGLIMGDHSKCGINTMFNTGTVVGVNANIFGAGFPRNFIPSFAWGGASGFTNYGLPTAFEVAEKVMERRHIPLTDIDKKILSHIFELTAKYRNF